MRVRATRLFSIGAGGQRPDMSVFAGAAAAYSVRIPAGSNYTGPLLRVRRSNDNAELDIGAVATPDANGDRFLDTVALLAFTGANSGLVTTWYDQSGNGRHAPQPTTTSQPRIVNAGVVDTINSKPSVFFVNAQDRVLPPSIPTAFALSTVGAPFGSGYRSIGTDSGAQHYLLRQVNGIDASVFVTGDGNSCATWIQNERATFFLDHTNTTSVNGLIGKNGSQLVDSVRNFTGTVATLGNSSTGNQAFGRICEAVYFNTTTQRQSIEQSQTLAYGLATGVFATPAAAYSTRIPAGSIYTGPLLRVRRSSDNAVLDINAVATPDANGDRWLDTTALLAFVGAGNGFVVTWYDQVSGRNYTQATAANQPRIVNAGVVDTFNGDPTLFLNAANQSMANGAFSKNIRTVNAVFNMSASTATLATLVSSANDQPIIRRAQTLSVGWRAAVSVNDYPFASTSRINGALAPTTADGQPAVANPLATPTVATFFPNGTAGPIAPTSLFISPISPSRVFAGSCPEITYFVYGVNDTSRQALEQSQGTAYGITLAV